MTISGQKRRVRRARGTAARVLYAMVLVVWSPPFASTQAPLVDLEGYWNLGTLTPLQRPTEFRGKTTLSIEDATEYGRTQFDRRLQLGGDNYHRLQADANDTWNETLALDRRRTALITDPSDGQLPPSAMKSGVAGVPPAPAPYDNPEDIELVARCLIATRGTTSQASPPMIPNTVFSPFYQIVQTADHVLVFTEWMHDARIVRLNSTHLPSAIRTWLGDSIGRWEGTTLVVDTTNFRREAQFGGSGANRHVVERFTRTGAQSIRYVVTVEDPGVWVTPWTAELTFNATKNQLFEFACHEGNQTVELFLRGARFAERESKNTP